MNWYFRRITRDGVVGWEKAEIVDSEPTQVRKSFSSAELKLHPNDFQENDLVEITHHPPIDIKNAKSLTELIKELEQMPFPPFQPSIFWNSYGEMLEVIWENVEYYVDYDKDNRFLAYCRSFDDKHIVGIKLHGVPLIKLGVEQRRNPKDG